MPKPNAEQIIKAHQFLYYVEAKSVWSDHQYDAFCKLHGIAGNGGSDLASDYTREIIELARRIEHDPHKPAYYPQPK